MQDGGQYFYFRGMTNIVRVHYADTPLESAVGAYVCALLNMDKSFFDKLDDIAEHIESIAEAYIDTLGEHTDGIFAYRHDKAKQCITEIQKTITDFIDTPKPTDIELQLTELVFLLPCYRTYNTLLKELQESPSEIAREAIQEEIYPGAGIKVDKYNGQDGLTGSTQQVSYDRRIMSGYKQWIDYLAYRTEEGANIFSLTDAIFGIYDNNARYDDDEGGNSRFCMIIDKAYAINLRKEVGKARRLWESVCAAYREYGEEEIRAALPVLSEEDRVKVINALKKMPDILETRIPARVTSEVATNLFGAPGGKEIRSATVFAIESLEELVCADVLHIKSRESEIKKCKICGTYFVPYQIGARYCPQCAKQGARATFLQKRTPAKIMLDRRVNTYFKWVSNNQDVNSDMVNLAIQFVASLDDIRRQDYFELDYYSDKLTGSETDKALEKEIRGLRKKIKNEISDRYDAWKEQATISVDKMESGGIVVIDMDQIPSLPSIEDRSPLLNRVKKAASKKL